jgi:hypothetical protein
VATTSTTTKAVHRRKPTGSSDSRGRCSRGRRRTRQHVSVPKQHVVTSWTFVHACVPGPQSLPGGATPPPPPPPPTPPPPLAGGS